MSTPSKRRRKARDWMAREKDERRREISGAQATAYRNGAEAMRRDMTALVTESDERRSYRDECGIHLMSVIPSFPDPREHGSFYRVPMPAAPLGPTMLMGRLSERFSVIDFRPIEHAFTRRGPYGSASVRWWTWEPTEGSDESLERTQALFTGMGKLSKAARLLDWVSASSQYSDFYPDEVRQARDLLRDASDELRRRLGKFAPNGNAT